MDLRSFEAAAWTELMDAAADPHAGFRYVTLCTADTAQRPQARIVVLRECDDARRRLTFHTDVRSPKWQEMAANPQVTVLGYCHERRLQLRLAGQVHCYAAGSEIARSIWRALPSHTRQTYHGGPPGEVRATASLTDESTDPEAGESRFGVVIVQVVSLDAYQLQRNDNQRALFRYAADGVLQAGEWINP